MSSISLFKKIERLVQMQVKQRLTIISLNYSKYFLAIERKKQGETSRDGDALPLKGQMREKGPLGPSRGHQTTDEGGKISREPITLLELLNPYSSVTFLLI